MTPASIIPVFGSQRPYADLNFAGGSFGLDGRSVSDLTALPGFTFTRASLAMGYDATGKLVYGPNNLLLMSQRFNEAEWTKSGSTITADTVAAPDGTLTADKLVEDTGNSQHRTFNNTGVTVSTTETVVYSIYAKAAGRNFLFLADNNGTGAYFNLTTGAVSNLGSGVTAVNATDAGNGWWRCCIARVPTTSSGRLAAGASTASGTNSYTGDGTSGLFIWGAQLEAVTYQTTPSTYYPTTTAAYYGPRLVYDPVTLASLGILVEEARTNLCLRSQTFDSATWTKQGGNTTVTANATTSPDGTADADLFTEAASGVISASCYQSITGAAGAYTWSVFFKAGSGSTRFLRLVIASSASDFGYMTVNMSTGAITQAAGVIGTATAASGDVTTLTGGWYRARLTTTLAAAPTIQFFVPLASGTASVVAGDYGRDTYTANGSTWSLYQAQLEAGTGASSPIPTTTASVTRAADDAILTGLSVPDGCTVMFEAYTPAFVSTDARMSLSDGTTNNRLESRVANTTSADIRSTVGGSGLLTQTVTVAAGSLNKVAASSLNGVFAGAVNGVLGSPASGGTMPTLTQIDIGKNPGSSIRYWNAPINRMRVWKSVQSVTSITA